MKSDDRLIYLLSMAKQALIDYTNKALLKEEVKLTIAQAGILFMLKQKNLCMMSELGQVYNIDNSAVTRLIDRLENNGLVERQVPPENRRAILIHITPRGLEEADKAKKVIKTINEEIKKGFTPEEIESYKKVLNGILEKFNAK